MVVLETREWCSSLRRIDKVFAHHGALVDEVHVPTARTELKLKNRAVGCVLASHAHGKGYATEAVRAAVAWGDAKVSLSRTACIIAPENAASIRVAVKCGYREFARTTYKGHPVLIFDREPQAS